MTNILAVPSVFADIPTAEAAIPAVPTEPQVIEIDTAAQQKYTTATNIDGSTFTQTNNLIIRPVANGLPYLLNGSIMFTVQDEFVILENFTLRSTNRGIRTVNGAGPVTIRKATLVSASLESARALEFDSPNVLVENCIIFWGSELQGTVVFGPLSNGSTFKNNMIIAQQSTSAGGRLVISGEIGASNITIQNNVIINNGADKIIDFVDDDPIGLTLNSNLYMIDSSLLVTAFARFGAAQYADLAAMQAATSFEANSPAQQGALGWPVFASRNDAGVADASVTEDFHGLARTGPMDIGMFRLGAVIQVQAVQGVGFDVQAS